MENALYIPLQNRQSVTDKSQFLHKWNWTIQRQNPRWPLQQRVVVQWLVRLIANKDQRKVLKRNSNAQSKRNFLGVNWMKRREEKLKGKRFDLRARVCVRHQHISPMWDINIFPPFISIPSSILLTLAFSGSLIAFISFSRSLNIDRFFPLFSPITLKSTSFFHSN